MLYSVLIIVVCICAGMLFNSPAIVWISVYIHVHNTVKLDIHVPGGVLSSVLHTSASNSLLDILSDSNTLGLLHSGLLSVFKEVGTYKGPGTI